MRREVSDEVSQVSTQLPFLSESEVPGHVEVRMRGQGEGGRERVVVTRYCSLDLPSRPSRSSREFSPCNRMMLSRVDTRAGNAKKISGTSLLRVSDDHSVLLSLSPGHASHYLHHHQVSTCIITKTLPTSPSRHYSHCHQVTTYIITKPVPGSPSNHYLDQHHRVIVATYMT